MLKIDIGTLRVEVPLQDCTPVLLYHEAARGASYVLLSNMRRFHVIHMQLNLTLHFDPLRVVCSAVKQ